MDVKFYNGTFSETYIFIKTNKMKIVFNRKEYNKKYYDKNKAKFLKHHKKYNKEYYSIPEISKKKKEYYKIYGPDYEKKNRLKINIYHKNHSKKIRNEDINVKIKDCLATRIYIALKNNTKSKKTTELLGCEVIYLKQYLEKQFTPEMTWDNYGTYFEIDHIKPCASFDLSKESEQRKCFNYTNLQPLTIHDNRTKWKN